MEEMLVRIETETDAAALRNLDMAYHDLVNDATHNRMLADTLARLRNQVSRAWDTNMPAGEDHYFSGIHEEFRLLLIAAREKDAEAVADVLRRHLARFVDEIIGFSKGGR